MAKTSKFVGVYYDKPTEKWVAIARINNKHTYLGRYDKEVTAATIAYVYRFMECGKYMPIHHVKIPKKKDFVW